MKSAKCMQRYTHGFISLYTFKLCIYCVNIEVVNMKKFRKCWKVLKKLKLLINSLVRGKCCISFGVNTTADNGRRRTPMFCCSVWLMTRKRPCFVLWFLELYQTWDVFTEVGILSSEIGTLPRFTVGGLTSVNPRQGLPFSPNR